MREQKSLPRQESSSVPAQGEPLIASYASSGDPGEGQATMPRAPPLEPPPVELPPPEVTMFPRPAPPDVMPPPPAPLEPPAAGIACEPALASTNSSALRAPHAWPPTASMLSRYQVILMPGIEALVARKARPDAD